MLLRKHTLDRQHLLLTNSEEVRLYSPENFLHEVDEARNAVLNDQLEDAARGSTSGYQSDRARSVAKRKKINNLQKLWIAGDRRLVLYGLKAEGTEEVCTDAEGMAKLLHAEGSRMFAEKQIAQDAVEQLLSGTEAWDWKDADVVEPHH
eukprot:10012188-Karenia_brevis.AAC.1